MGVQSFGDFIKRQRKRCDLTQHALAARLGCAVITLRKIEAGTRRPSRQIAQRLADVLAIPADERAAFFQHARPPFPPTVPPTAQSFAGSLPLVSTFLPPPASPLIGRTHALADLTAMLREPTLRLITLTGPGGVGKTRLAQEVATTVQDAFPDGVVFVSLGSLPDPAFVGSTIARSFHLTETHAAPLISQLAPILRDKQLLLVLDNFEHLLPAAALIYDLLAATTTLTILVTSRRVLQLSAEHVVVVPPLTVPQLAAPQSAPDVLNATSVALFVQQAQMRDRSFTLTPTNAAAVGAICVQLDGLPLAIVLAAARSRFLTPHQLLHQLRSPLAFLTLGPQDLPPRQHTLRAAIGWSYQLLSTAEQHVFRSIAVCVAGWTIAAADAIVGCSNAVCQHQPTAMITTSNTGSCVRATLESLLNQSLLEPSGESDDEPGFVMLETIRAYALEQLDPQETITLCQKHAMYYRTLAEQAAAALHGTEQGVWLARIDAALANIRVALHWSIAHNDAVTALCIASALWRYWSVRGMIVEGSRWIERAFATNQALPADVQGHALAVLSSLTVAQGDLVRAQALALESRALLTPLGDAEGLGTALGMLGLIALSQHAYAQATPLLEESLQLARVSGDLPGIAWGLTNLSGAYMFCGDLTQAQRASAEAMQVYQLLGDQDGMLVTLQNRGWFAALQQDFTHACVLYRACVQLCRDLQESGEVMCELLEKLAATLVAQARHACAARLLGAAAAQRAVIQCPIKRYNQAEYDQTLATTQVVLQGRSFAAAWNSGHAMTLPQVTTYILDTVLPEEADAFAGAPEETGCA